MHEFEIPIKLQLTILCRIEILVRIVIKSEFDLIAVGRALLSDPDWANKVQDGKEDQIVPFDKSFVENYV